MEILKLSNFGFRGKSLPKQTVREYHTSEHVLNEKKVKIKNFCDDILQHLQRQVNQELRKKESLALEDVGEHGVSGNIGFIPSIGSITITN